MNQEVLARLERVWQRILLFRQKRAVRTGGLCFPALTTQVCDTALQNSSVAWIYSNCPLLSAEP